MQGDDPNQEKPTRLYKINGKKDANAKRTRRERTWTTVNKKNISQEEIHMTK